MAFSDDFKKVIRGSFWVVLGVFTLNLGGLVFWLLSGRIAGAEAIGYATGAFSIAMMLTSIGDLGLTYSVLREVPVRGPYAYTASLILALTFGFIISLLSLLFVGLYGGFLEYIPLTIGMTIAGITTLVSTRALMASLHVKHVFAIDLTATIAKVLLGVVLAVLGFGGFGLALAILSSQTIALISSVALAILLIGVKIPKVGDVVRVLKIGVSNYPQTLSIQLIVSCGVVLLALLTNDPRSTGLFYIAITITVALAAIPGNVAIMSLPVMVKTSNYRLAGESLRVGGGLILPLIVAVGLASRDVLAFINPELQAGGLMLTLLTLTIIPQATIFAGISKLNTEQNLLQILKIGSTELVVLVLLIVFLTPYYGVLGAAVAFLVSTLAPIPLLRSTLNLGEALKLMMVQFIVLVLALVFTLLVGLTFSILIAVLATVTILHLVGMLKIKEILEVVRTVFKT